MTTVEATIRPNHAEGAHDCDGLEVRVITASLSGIAQRHARVGASPAVAVPELLERAAGRTDLLADAAGRAVGGYLASPLYPADLLAAPS